ncbi:Permeases of the major facilitator superfamily [Nitrosotalea sinensis]|uniref:Permeases of the major facilitator superfamily n=1 Tax=Nitrosotalea sinensis TaxID=1499975 RepID=A0A2H1EG97_9ARCH|nr:MFS transporter [Candidatus Nitrosotalea sinensis]SHO45183.1 Permeases of the major facilitator superfamily [Candidatus Nitrosotalea sinensis]
MYSKIESSVRRKKFLRIVPFIFILYVISFLDRTNISYATLTMSKDLHFTAAAFGLGAGIFFAGYLIFQIPVTIFAEKKSARKWISMTIMVWSAVAIATSLVNFDWQFYIMRFALGVGEAGLFTSLVVYISHWFTVKERAGVISILLSAIFVSQIIGGPISTQILTYNWGDITGWRWLFILEGIPALAIGIMSYFYLKDKPSQAKWLDAEEKKYLEDQLDLESKAKTKFDYSWKQAIRDRETIILCIIYTFWLATAYALLFFLPTMFSEITKTPVTTVGYITAITYTGSLVGLILVGRSSDKKNERKMHMFIPLVIGIIALAASMAIHQDATLATIILAIAVTGIGSAFGIFWTLPTMFLSRTAAAVSLGVIGTVGNIGGFFGPYITGVLRTTTGSFMQPTVIMIIFLAISASLVLTLRKTQMPNTESA